MPHQKASISPKHNVRRTANGNRWKRSHHLPTVSAARLVRWMSASTSHSTNHAGGVKTMAASTSQIKKTATVLSGGDAKKAAAELTAAMRLIDKAAKAGVIHKNTAARKKSQLARQLAALQKGK